MQSPGCTTWVKAQTKAVLGISLEALTATTTFTATSEPPFSWFPLLCSLLITTTTINLSKTSTCSLNQSPHYSYRANNKSMTTRRTKIFHALLHCPIHVGFKRQEPPTKNLYPSRYSSGRPHLWQDPFHYLTQAPLESITKTYFTALQLYLAPPLINQQIVNPPTQKKKTRKDLDTLWLKMQEPDYTSRNSTKKKSWSCKNIHRKSIRKH